MAAPCTGNTQLCETWGTPPVGTGSIGSCCIKRTVGYTAAADANGRCKATQNAQIVKCGNLHDLKYDAVLGVWVCGNLTAAEACGGPSGVFGLCANVACGGS